MDETNPQPPRPPSPRSPRPNAAEAPTVPPPPFPPGSLVGLNNGPAPPPRASLSSMLFLTAFFFLMSGGNNVPQQEIVIGPDGQFRPRFTELDLARKYVDEYKVWMNGTNLPGNWTEPSPPEVLASSLIPPEYVHSSTSEFFTNITGFYRDARMHAINLTSPELSIHSTHFFRHLDTSHHLPLINKSKWNESLASELRGTFPWEKVSKWEMNVKERSIDSGPSGTSSKERDEDEFSEWAWIKGSATLSTGAPLEVDIGDSQDMNYNFYGLHYLPNGTYDLFGRPDGYRIDIRNIPRLYSDLTAHNISTRIILRELEKELEKEERLLMSGDVRDDPINHPTIYTECPIIVHLSLPPLPVGTTKEMMELYEEETRNPTGIRTSLPNQPNYWEGIGLGGVVIADQCGWGFGIEGGTGVRIDDFWRKSVNYAAYATLLQLTLLLLLVRQMESTRTPSTLAKVSLWSIVMMGVSDSWVFSAHVVVGIVSDNRTSIPMLVPGFLCLCTAVVFGPRYAVLLHRIQAPERVVPTRPNPPAATTPAVPTGGTQTTNGATPTIPTPLVAPAAEDRSFLSRLIESFRNSPGLLWVISAFGLYVVFMFALQPSLAPTFLFLVYSFWIPQIYRNATRGTSNALDWWFVIGTSVGRLGLPLYAFACPDNVFFTKPNQWVWGLVAWQWFQVLVMFAQDRFGSGFFLPKSFSPPESYNYHPILSPPDAESGPLLPDSKGDGNNNNLETTCSICMEEVNIYTGPSSDVLMGLNARRAYALAPCHHLFHTKCLSQWLAIKTICPLCKRSLPPL